MAEKSQSPSGDIVAANLHDTNPLTNGVCRGVYVGATGDLKLVTPKGQTVTLAGLAAGLVHPIQAKQIFSTGTTATGVMVLY